MCALLHTDHFFLLSFLTQSCSIITDEPRPPMLQQRPVHPAPPWWCPRAALTPPAMLKRCRQAPEGMVCVCV